MKTPEAYRDHLKNGIITKDMLNDCLYSMNKRAKNYRDAARRSIRPVSGFYKWREDKCYKSKVFMLSILKPDCIHCLEHHYFLVYKLEDYSYHVPMADFDSCLPDSYYENYAKEHDLKIVPIWFLITAGEKLQKLLPARFVKKVIKRIREGKYIFQ